MSTSAVQRDRSGWERLSASVRPEGRAFIAGRPVAARDGGVFDDISPIDGKVVCQVARCRSADVDAAVAAARASFETGPWRRMEPKERKRILRRFAELIRADVDRLALLETRDVGKPIMNSVSVDVANCADCIEYYAEFADKLYDEVAPTGPNDLALVRREPLGVVAAIVPWNYPLIISTWKVGPALLTGNSVVLKPAEQSPLSGIRLGELACEAGAHGIAWGVYYNSGETCHAGSRLIVQESAKDALLAAIGRVTATITLGHPLDPATQMGALIDRPHMQRVLGFIDSGVADGARIALGGRQALEESGGFYVEATVLDGVRPDMKVAREEIFGPVLAVMSFRDESEAVRLANDTPYGLAASVWTADMNVAHRVSGALRGGTVWVNAFDRSTMATPFGGFKLSGSGRDRSPHAIEKYCDLKTIWTHYV